MSDGGGKVISFPKPETLQEAIEVLAKEYGPGLDSFIFLGFTKGGEYRFYSTERNYPRLLVASDVARRMADAAFECMEEVPDP